MIRAKHKSPRQELNEARSPENTGDKQDGRFPRGVSGNPAGRPKGARNRATRVAEALLHGEAEGLMRKLLDLALAGDPGALRLCVERLVAKRTEPPIEFELPTISEPRDAAAALSRVMEGLASGHLTASEARSLVGVVEATLKAFEVLNLDERMTALEERMDAKQA